MIRLPFRSIREQDHCCFVYVTMRENNGKRHDDEFDEYREDNKGIRGTQGV